ncbi:MAG: response regulator transcription factor [Treponema sp.]|jgi:DNA-binding NarL/FixJ family response regulator|nr:response regulator transcription factor [Treponema sp.]
MIKIVVIDDRKQDRDLIFSILSAQKEFEVSGSGKDGYDALKLAVECRPHIIIMDLRSDSMGGPELVPLIKRKSPATAVIILSGYEDDEYAGKALSSGASGYLVKKTDMNKLADSVRTVYNGGYFINTPAVVRIFGRLSGETEYKNVYRTAGQSKKQPIQPVPTNLNQTELKIMAFIGKGYNSKEIAASLRLKPGTVRNYLSSAMHKAGLKSRTQVAIFAIENGLTENRKPQ